MPGPGRDPYRDVKRQLRQEVGFACPVADCGNPYLTWHHFDPPWRYEHHHRPEGMIALCLEHAAQADNGAFTDDQLRTLKASGGNRLEAVRGRFNWMRQDILVRIGGNFYYRTPVIFELGSVPCIWLSQDPQGNMLVNFRMPTLSSQPRASIIENFWSVPTAVQELICPPSGRLIEVRYENGDRFKAEFSEVTDAAALQAKYRSAQIADWHTGLAFPITLVEVWETAAGTNLEFGPDESKIGGITMRDCFAANCGAGIHVEVDDQQLALLFPPEGDDGLS